MFKKLRDRKAQEQLNQVLQVVAKSACYIQTLTKLIDDAETLEHVLNGADSFKKQMKNDSVYSTSYNVDDKDRYHITLNLKTDKYQVTDIK